MSDVTAELAFEAWAGLWLAQGRIMSAIEGDLKNSNLPPLSWYDVLLELERAVDEGLRPFELERAILLPQYGLSRLLDRIERKGCLERRPCLDDRRGLNIVITAEGRALRKRMWPVYKKAIKGNLEDKFSAAELETMNQLLARIKAP